MKGLLGKFAKLSALLLIVTAMTLGAAGCTTDESDTTDNGDTGSNTEQQENETSTETNDTEIALTVKKGEQEVSYTLSDIKAMPAEEGWGGIMNSSGVISGPFTQKGVKLMDLLNKVGGISDGDAIRITAKDGYAMTYSYDQIANGNYTTLEHTTGEEIPHDALTTIISYEEDGVELDDQVGPLRIAILNDDNQVTEGHWWIKWAKEIEIVPGEKTWSLHLEGFMNEDVDPGSFESCAAPGCHGASWTDADGGVWDGIPLYFLAGRVDDDNPHSKEEQAFNDTVADAGYEVKVEASDGYSKTFTSEEIKRSNDYIIAFRYNDEPLPEDKWPLRLVGPNLTTGQMVSMISNITLIGLPEEVEEPEWTLSLIGATSEEITDSYFASAYEDCHTATWTDDDGREWQGVPLWLFVGRVDDDFNHSTTQPGAFNDDLADAGYDVVVTAADGYSKTFAAELVKRNDNMIIAFMRDGAPLPENQYPLRLVGPDMTKGEMVGQIVSIEVIFP